jgi:hypothetical protein
MKDRKFRRAVALLLVFVVQLFVAGCGNSHSYRFLTENDSYHPVERPDANYTSGLLFMAEPARQYWKGDNKLVDKLNFFQRDDYGEHTPITLEYGVGQVFYTPDDIAVASLDAIDRNERVLREDRPYAGLLFFQGAVHNHYMNDYDETQDMRRTVLAKVGLTGNGSFSEELHTAVHKRRDLIVPVGWGMQVGQEVAFSLGLEQTNRLLSWKREVFKSNVLGADVSSNVGATLGNIYTGLDAGVTLRVGFNLPRRVQDGTIAPAIVVPAPPEVAPPDVPVPINEYDENADDKSSTLIDPAGADINVPDAEPDVWPDTDNTDYYEVATTASDDKSWHLYFFLGHQNRWVHRDFSIDGRVFGNDIHTVEREPVVNEFQYGGQVRFADHWVVQALFAHRSKQFKSQRKEHSFGQYMIMYQRPLAK